MSQVSVAEPDETLDPAPRLELSRAQMNVVFVTILLGLLLSALDQTIVSTALPTIVGDLGGAGHVSWVVYREIASAGYLTRADDGVPELTERGQAEADKLVAAWKAWLMGELRDWLATHEVSPAQASEVEAALGRITLRLVREAEAEAGRTPAVTAARADSAADAASAPSAGSGASGWEV